MAASSEKTIPMIRKLDETVVNRIAAGEVIQRPANALKELMENSLDAGSTTITVQVKSGGLKMLQISDNGCGIRKEDMSIVCERFTTSKLDKFEDLQSIGTFGFRGEALASISHVAHVNIVTKTKDSKCAWKAAYSDGLLKGDPRPCAGNRGTVITVEDLFYNVATRKKALNNPTEEHAKIADVVTRYAIHNSGKGFTLKKAGDSNTDVKTAVGSSICDNIRNVYGGAVAKELIQVDFNDDNYQFSISGYISGPNYESKRMVLLLFINNRLVDCPSIRKALANIYGSLLSKGGHPFAYLSLTVPSQTIDVNVHPTKHEVHFLHEDAIVEAIEKQLESRLLDQSESRKFAVQTLLPNVSQPLDQTSTSGGRGSAGAKRENVYAHQLVRTDCKSQKLDAFFEVSKKDARDDEESGVPMDFRRTSVSDVEVKDKLADNDVESEEHSAMGFVEGNNNHTGQSSTSSGAAGADETLTSRNESVHVKRGQDDLHDKDEDEASRDSTGDSSLTMGFNEPFRRPILLKSVRELGEEFRAFSSADLKTLFKDSVFVGCVSHRHAILQHSTSLYLVNIERLSAELFYQIMIADFGNYGLMRLSSPAPIVDLARLALDSPESGWDPADGPKEQMAEFCRDLLVEKRDMLEEYFSLEIDETGNLKSLPLLLDEYRPCLDHLPLLLIKLAGEVDWEEEKPCFQTLCRTMAGFYAVKEPLEDEEEDFKDKEEGRDAGATKSEAPSEGVVRMLPSGPGSWPWVVENVIYRALKSGNFCPCKQFATDGSVLRVANLTDLYKVFERC